MVRNLARESMLRKVVLILALFTTLAPRGATPAQAQGLPVIDIPNIIRQGVDLVLQSVKAKLLEGTRREAFHHYRRVTQYVGVDVFISGAPRAALTATAPASPKKAYAELYAPAYAAGVPERVQDSLAAERITLMQHRNLATLDSIQYVIAHLQQQVETLGEELERRLTRPAAAAPEGANRQGDVAQLKAAIGAKTASIATLHARAEFVQAHQGTVSGLYSQQAAARLKTRTMRASAEFVGTELPQPLVFSSRYDGPRSILRFPGLRK